MPKYSIISETLLNQNIYSILKVIVISIIPWSELPTQSLKENGIRVIRKHETFGHPDFGLETYSILMEGKGYDIILLSTYYDWILFLQPVFSEIEYGTKQI